MMSCSSAYRRIAETSPPSWPTSANTGSDARGEDDVLVHAGGLARSRARPKRNSSTSGSQARNRGHARVHDVQPLLAVAAVVGRVAVLELERAVDALGVAVAEHVVRARDDAPGAPGTEPRRDHLSDRGGSPVQLSQGHARESASHVRSRRGLDGRASARRLDLQPVRRRAEGLRVGSVLGRLAARRVGRRVDAIRRPVTRRHVRPTMPLGSVTDGRSEPPRLRALVPEPREIHENLQARVLVELEPATTRRELSRTPLGAHRRTSRSPTAPADPHASARTISSSRSTATRR